jgi:hypothetical protein
MRRFRRGPWYQIGVQTHQFLLGFTFNQMDFDGSYWAASIYIGPIYIDVWRKR